MNKSPEIRARLARYQDQLQAELSERMGDRAPRVLDIAVTYRQADDLPYTIGLQAQFERPHGERRAIGVSVEGEDWEAAYRALIRASLDA